MKTDEEFKGYHKFRAMNGSEYGSFEVHHLDERVATADPEQPFEIGWYWRACFPGCLPDGDDVGPFPTAEGAYLDAMEGGGKVDITDNPDDSLPDHGDWAIPSSAKE